MESSSEESKELGVELEVLNGYLASFCFTLLDVNKDFFY